jgi:hypothetical protein
MWQSHQLMFASAHMLGMYSELLYLPNIHMLCYIFTVLMMILPQHVLQIYNECIHDLLAPPSQRGKPSALRLKEDKAGHIQVRSVHACARMAA